MEKERGKYVSRAVYAKLQAENKRLIKDIKLIVKQGSKSAETFQKWKKHFEAAERYNDLLSEALTQFPNVTTAKIDSNPGAFKTFN